MCESPGKRRAEATLEEERTRRRCDGAPQGQGMEVRGEATTTAQTTSEQSSEQHLSRRSSETTTARMSRGRCSNGYSRTTGN